MCVLVPCEDKQLLTTVELDMYVKEYNSTLSAAFDRHASQKTRTRVTRPTVPWYNETIDVTNILYLLDVSYAATYNIRSDG